MKTKITIREKGITFSLFAFLFLVSISVLCEPPLPGWRFPGEADYQDDWLLSRGNIARPFHISADFNGDNLDDEAWILLSKNRKEWGVFVFLSQIEGRIDVRELDRSDMSTISPQSMGLSVMPQGKYKTACGKGYGSCSVDDPKTISFPYPAIDFFKYESANSVFYWDIETRKFKREWLSD